MSKNAHGSKLKHQMNTTTTNIVSMPEEMIRESMVNLTRSSYREIQDQINRLAANRVVPFELENITATLERVNQMLEAFLEGNASGDQLIAALNACQIVSATIHRPLRNPETLVTTRQHALDLQAKMLPNWVQIEDFTGDDQDDWLPA